MLPHEADYVLYFSRDRIWHVYHMLTGAETYHANVRFVGEVQTFYDGRGIQFLPGKPLGVILVKGKVYFDEA